MCARVCVWEGGGGGGEEDVCTICVFSLFTLRVKEWTVFGKVMKQI